MIGAPPTPSPSRLTPAWHVTLLASCVAVGLSAAAAARADSYPAGPPHARTPATLGSADTATLTCSPAEADGMTGAAWAEAGRLAAYLRLHYAADDRLIALSPLAAYVAGTRRADSVTGGAQGARRSDAAPPTMAVAAGGVPRAP